MWDFVISFYNIDDLINKIETCTYASFGSRSTTLVMAAILELYNIETLYRFSITRQTMLS